MTGEAEIEKPLFAGLTIYSESNSCFEDLCPDLNGGLIYIMANYIPQIVSLYLTQLL